MRSPKLGPRDAVQPLSPVIVELIRAELLNPAPRQIATSKAGKRRRRGYELLPPGAPETRRRDALIVSLLAYAGLRAGNSALCGSETFATRRSSFSVLRIPTGRSRPRRPSSTVRFGCSPRSRRTCASTGSRSVGHQATPSSSATPHARGTAVRRAAARTLARGLLSTYAHLIARVRRQRTHRRRSRDRRRARTSSFGSGSDRTHRFSHRARPRNRKAPPHRGLRSSTATGIRTR